MMWYGEIMYGVECDVEIFTVGVKWARCSCSLLDNRYLWLCCEQFYLFV